MSEDIDRLARQVSLLRGWLKQEVTDRKRAQRDLARARKEANAQRSRASVEATLRMSLQKRLDGMQRDLMEARKEIMRTTDIEARLSRLEARNG